MKYLLPPSLIVLIFSSCSSVKSLPEPVLIPGYYLYRQPDRKYSKVYLQPEKDSLTVIPIDKHENTLSPLKHTLSPIFLKQSFDIDVLVVPFKFRPPSYNSTRQINAEFNGNMFFGYRLDRFKTQTVHKQAGQKHGLQHHAITMGAFGGFGSSFIGPLTTNYQTTDEYSGLILTRGISLMVGVRDLTVGVGVGWDYLTDRDKNIWIYQNKPWYGLTLSLNLN